MDAFLLGHGVKRNTKLLYIVKWKAATTVLISVFKWTFWNYTYFETEEGLALNQGICCTTCWRFSL